MCYCVFYVDINDEGNRNYQRNNTRIRRLTSNDEEDNEAYEEANRMACGNYYTLKVLS